MPEPISPVPHARVKLLLERVRKVHVAVIGDVMLDRYLMGDTERISPEAPVPVITVDDEVSVPGGAANVAVNVAAAGARVSLAGAIGDDDTGTALRDAIASLDISTAGLLVVPGRPTTSKLRVIARGQQVVRIDREVTNPLPDRFRDAFLVSAHAMIGKADVVLVEDYDKGTIDAAMAAELVAAGRRRNIPIVVDPKLKNFFAYSGATVFKPNRRELETAFGTHFMGDDADLEDARQRLGAEHLLVTLGREGMAVVSPGAAMQVSASAARDVFDVSGAGDTVAAWIAVALAAGANLAEAAWLANAAAGIEVSKRGTASVSPAELLTSIDAK